MCAGVAEGEKGDCAPKGGAAPRTATGKRGADRPKSGAPLIFFFSRFPASPLPLARQPLRRAFHALFPSSLPLLSASHTARDSPLVLVPSRRPVRTTARHRRERSTHCRLCAATPDPPREGREVALCARPLAPAGSVLSVPVLPPSSSLSSSPSSISQALRLAPLFELLPSRPLSEPRGLLPGPPPLAPPCRSRCAAYLTPPCAVRLPEQPVVPPTRPTRRRRLPWRTTTPTTPRCE